MKEVEYNFYTKLKAEGSVNKSNIPKSIINSTYYSNLLEANTLEEIKVGRGRICKILNKNSFNEIYTKRFPNSSLNKGQNRVSSVAKYRNSKVGNTNKSNIFLIHGIGSFTINDSSLNLSKGSLHAYKNPSIKADKIILVENLQAFLDAEALFGENHLFIHKYGRIGKDDLIHFKSNTFIVFSDYDFTGLDEFLRVKKSIGHAAFYIPENFQELFEKYSTPIKKKSAASKQLEENNNIEIQQLLSQIKRTNRFLEQEALYIK
jgi:hypothetical protein